MHARQDHQAGTGQRGASPALWRGATAAATVIATAALALTAGAVPASAAGGYTVTATIPVGSGPIGVAVDPAAGSVYVANYSSDSASVIDEATNTVTDTIPLGGHAWDVAVDPAAGTVYVTNNGDGTVSVINDGTNAVTATIPVGSRPNEVAVDPAAGTVYVANSGDGTVSVINAATNAVTATIPVGSGPDGMAVDPATHAAYVTNNGDSTVSVISADLPVPVTTVTSSQDPSTFGQKVTFTATIAPVNGGTITFANGATVLCAAVPLTHVGGSTYKAKCATTALPAGFATITAAYPGDTSYAASAGTLTQTVAQAPTALTARFSTSHQDLVLTAKLTAAGDPVSGQPISFSTGTTPLCTPDTSADGVATCTLTTAQTVLAEQDHDTIQASYSGNADYQPSSATLTPP